MFEKFGEFDSAEEMNMTATGLLREGDIESLKVMALENGLQEEDVEDFIDETNVEELKEEDVAPFVTDLMAAYGKLNVEEKELTLYEIMNDWVAYIRAQCIEKQEMAIAVRRKGKSLKGCMGEMLKWSFKNAKIVDERIMKEAGITTSCKMGIPGMKKAKEIITKYYIGK